MPGYRSGKSVAFALGRQIRWDDLPVTDRAYGYRAGLPFEPLEEVEAQVLGDAPLTRAKRRILPSTY